MLYEQAGGKGETIHQYMMENNLVGCDILPNAAHLTASIVASTYPDIFLCVLYQKLQNWERGRRIFAEVRGEGLLTLKKDISDTAEYPSLWHVHSESQRTMVVSPDAHAHIRPHAEVKAEKILELNGRVHFNRDIRFNSHSLAVMFTEQNAIGIVVLSHAVPLRKTMQAKCGLIRFIA